MKIAGGWSQTPNEIIAQMPLMSGAEFKCTMVLIRETYGYHRREVRLTYKDFRQQTGIKSDRTIAEALSAISSRGFFLQMPKNSKWMIAEGQDTIESKENGGQSSLEIEECGEDNALEIKEGWDESTLKSIEQSRPDTLEIKELHLYKERSPAGKERGRERKGAPASAGTRAAGRMADQEEGIAEGNGNDGSADGGRRLIHPEVPRPRTAVEMALAAHPGTRVWLEAGMAWPGWEQLAEITTLLGREPRPDLLQRARKMWLMAGYRPGNFGGILDWYAALCRDPAWRPFPRAKGQSGRPAAGRDGPHDQTMAMLLKMREEIIDEQRNKNGGLSDHAEIRISEDEFWGGVGADLPADAGRY